MQRKIKDLYLAAFLRVRGLPLEGVVSEGKVLYFLFADTLESTRLQEEFFSSSEHNVNALRYQSEIRNLKTMVHNRLTIKPDDADNLRNRGEGERGG